MQFGHWKKESIPEHCCTTSFIDTYDERVYIPKSFCVDYIEEFHEEQGNGKFTLIIKQEKKDVENVKIEGGYGA